MRRLIAASALAFGALGLLLGAGAPASAQSGSVCASVTVTVNGDGALDEDECVVLPPDEG